MHSCFKKKFDWSWYTWASFLGLFSHSWNHSDLCDPWNYILIWFIRFQLVSLYTCLLRFIINANVLIFFFHFHSGYIFLILICYMKYRYIHCSTAKYLHSLDNLWTCCSPFINRNSIKKEEIKTLITNNYKYCIWKKWKT